MTIIKNILNGINNLINNESTNIGELRSSAEQFKDAEKLALIISRHPGVEGMRVNLNELRKEITKGHEGLYTSMTLTFTWQGIRMVLAEDYEFSTMARSMILSINGEKVSRIFWSVNAGLTTHHWRDLTPNEDWFEIHILLKAIWKWSHTSGRLISLNQKIRIGNIEIGPNEDRTTVMATINGETIPMMGHTLRGCIWWSCDPRLQEGIEVVKKAFRKPF